MDRGRCPVPLSTSEMHHPHAAEKRRKQMRAMFAVRVVVTLCINALDLDVDLRAIILNDHGARRCAAKIGTSLPKVRLGQSLTKTSSTQAARQARHRWSCSRRRCSLLQPCLKADLRGPNLAEPVRLATAHTTTSMAAVTAALLWLSREIERADKRLG